MIKSINFLLSKRFPVLILLMSVVLQAQATALFTLKGNTDAVKYPEDAELRLSVLGWSDADAGMKVISGLNDYKVNGNVEVLKKLLQEQATKGYLFTKAATGHSIKYAWQDTNADGQRMVLLVVPALKTLNPYMWKETNTALEPYSLLEVRREGEQFVLKTSLDTAVDISAKGHLELRDFTTAGTFAMLEDNTPYYLKSAL